MSETLEQLLTRHEGKKRSAYQDINGFWTIGIGRLIDSRKGGGLSEDEIQYLLKNDILRVSSNIKKLLPWVHTLTNNRYNVIISIAFNVGVNGLLKFKKMLLACEIGDFNEASLQILDSNVARELPTRYQELAKIMREG